MAYDGCERRERPVVHVGRGELDVAQRRDAERELIEILGRQIAAAAVERRRFGRPGSELRNAGVREAAPAQQWPAMAARALRFSEEQACPTLLLRGQGRVVVIQVPVERRVRPGEDGHLERGERLGRVLE